MAALTTPPKPKFSSFFHNLDYTSRFVFLSLGLASVSLFTLATLLQKELDKILQQVSADLIAQKISQSSFRTFIETYKAVR